MYGEKLLSNNKRKLTALVAAGAFAVSACGAEQSNTSHENAASKPVPTATAEANPSQHQADSEQTQQAPEATMHTDKLSKEEMALINNFIGTGSAPKNESAKDALLETVGFLVEEKNISKDLFERALDAGLATITVKGPNESGEGTVIKSANEEVEAHSTIDFKFDKISQ